MLPTTEAEFFNKIGRKPSWSSEGFASPVTAAFGLSGCGLNRRLLIPLSHSLATALSPVLILLPVGALRGIFNFKDVVGALRFKQ